MSKIDFASFLHRKKISQPKLAKALGVANATVNMYCKGRSDITFGKVEKLVDLGITPEELFGEIAGKKLRDMCVNDYLAEQAKEADVLKEVRELRADLKEMKARMEDLEQEKRKPAAEDRIA
jgi:transcriptional regulator with XRE-family HTH domain